MPRDHWLTDGEKRAIRSLQEKFPLEGHRRLAFTMIGRDAAACSPTSVWRVLSQAGRLQSPPATSRSPSAKPA